MDEVAARTIDLQRVMESLPDHVVVLELADGDVLVRALNSVLAEAFGQERDALVGRPLAELQPPNVVEAARTLVADTLDQGIPLRREIELTVEGGRRTLDVTVIPMSDHDRQVLIVTRDLTGVREVTAALDETQAIARIGHWAWDIEADRITWTDELYRIFGVDPETWDATYESYARCLHPEDRAEVEETVQNALDERSAYTHQHRIVRPSGEVRVVSSLGHVVTDPEGNAIRLAGTAQDITERIQAEEEALRLREAHARHEQGLELNDNVMQGLAVTRLALMEDDPEHALQALDRTMEAAREIIRTLLEARVDDNGLRPGDLVRTSGALQMDEQ